MRKIDPVKHEEKRRELLAAAARCFVRSGFQGASISQICPEARISPGHLYHYFPSKDAIIADIAKAHLDEMRGRFEKIVESGEDVSSALLSEMSRLRGRADDTARPLLLDMLAESKRNLAVAGILQCHSQTMIRLLADTLRPGQSRGDIDKALDPESAATVLLSIIDGAKAMSVRHSDIPHAASDDLFDRLISRILSGAIAG